MHMPDSLTNWQKAIIAITYKFIDSSYVISLAKANVPSQDSSYNPWVQCHVQPLGIVHVSRILIIKCL